MPLPSPYSVFLHLFLNASLVLAGVALSVTLYSGGVTAVYTALLVRLLLLLWFLEWGTRGKPLNGKRTLPQESFPGEFVSNMLVTVASDTLIVLVARPYVVPARFSLTEALAFLPVSFLHEVVFDFFHYWGHRLCHEVPLLYRRVHKKHHTFHHPTVMITFYQDPSDLVLTNVLPFLAAFFLVRPRSALHLAQLMVTKSYTEMSGHVGRELFPSSSFPQCVWLPRLLSIELYAEDHDNHHKLNDCNFSKRFCLWDKAFGTLYRPESLSQKSSDRKANSLSRDKRD